MRGTRIGRRAKEQVDKQREEKREKGMGRLGVVPLHYPLLRVQHLNALAGSMVMLTGRALVTECIGPSFFRQACSLNVLSI